MHWPLWQKVAFFFFFSVDTLTKDTHTRTHVERSQAPKYNLETFYFFLRSIFSFSCFYLFGVLWCKTDPKDGRRRSQTCKHKFTFFSFVVLAELNNDMNGSQQKTNEQMENVEYLYLWTEHTNYTIKNLVLNAHIFLYSLVLKFSCNRQIRF